MTKSETNECLDTCVRDKTNRRWSCSCSSIVYYSMYFFLCVIFDKSIQYK